MLFARTAEFIITCAEDLVTQPSTYFAALIDTSGNLVWSTPLLPVSESITSIKSNATLTEERTIRLFLHGRIPAAEFLPIFTFKIFQWMVSWEWV